MYFEKSFFNWDQGCQMVCFQTKNPNLGKFWRVLQWKMLVYILCPFGLFYSHWKYFYSHLVYFVVIWYIFPRFGVLYTLEIWQPWQDWVSTYKHMLSDHSKATSCRVRVTRIFAYGRQFNLDSFLIITDGAQIFGGTFLHGKNWSINFGKKCVELSTFWAFFINSSGHPGNTKCKNWHRCHLS
jgi:hypothetical protein